tara:strand:- start:237 stop:572 length:336 start_codon:yes stop_codon:yes gene_type:complete
MNKTKTKPKGTTYFEKYDLYSDANPKDTIRIKYTTEKDVKDTIKKLEKIYKSGEKPHNRISQITNVLKQRLRVINPTDKRLDIATKYFDFLKNRTKVKNDKDRKKMSFKYI